MNTTTETKTMKSQPIYFRTDSNYTTRHEIFAMMAVCNLFGAFAGKRGKVVNRDWQFVWA